jgi:hypothetical protein
MRRIRRPSRPTALAVTLVLSLGLLAPVVSVLPTTSAVAEEDDGPPLPSAYYVEDTTGTDVSVFINGEQLEFDFSGFGRYGAAAPDFTSRRFTRIDGTRFLLRIEAPEEMAGSHVGVELIVCVPGEDGQGPDCGAVADAQALAALVVEDECDDFDTVALPSLGEFDGRLGFIRGVLDEDGVFDCVLDLGEDGALDALGLAIEIGPTLETFRQESEFALANAWPNDGDGFFDASISREELDELVEESGCLNLDDDVTAADVLDAWFGDEGGLATILDCPSGRVDISDPGAVAFNTVVWSSQREFGFAAERDDFLDGDGHDVVLGACESEADAGPCVEVPEDGWEVILRDWTGVSAWVASWEDGESDEELAELEIVLRRTARVPKGDNPRQGYGILPGDRAAVALRLPVVGPERDGGPSPAAWRSLIRPFMSTAAAVSDYVVTSVEGGAGAEDDHVRFALSFVARARSVALSTQADDSCALVVDEDSAEPSDCDVPESARRIRRIRMRPIAYFTATGPGSQQRITTAADYWTVLELECDPMLDPWEPGACVEIPDPDGDPVPAYDVLRDACGFPQRFYSAEDGGPLASAWFTVVEDVETLRVPLHARYRWDAQSGRCDPVRLDPTDEMTAAWPKDGVTGDPLAIGDPGGPTAGAIDNLLRDIVSIGGTPVECYGYAWYEDGNGDPVFYDAYDLEDALFGSGEGRPTVLEVTFCVEQTRVTFVAVSDGFGGSLAGPGCEGAQSYCPPLLVPVTDEDGELLDDLDWSPTFEIVPEPTGEGGDGGGGGGGPVADVIRTEAIVLVETDGGSIYEVATTLPCLDADDDEVCDPGVIVPGAAISDEPYVPLIVPDGSYVLVLAGGSGGVPSFVTLAQVPVIGDTVVPVGVDPLIDGTPLTLAGKAFTNYAFVLPDSIGEDLFEEFEECSDDRLVYFGFFDLCESDARDSGMGQRGVLTIVTAGPHGLGGIGDVLDSVHLSLLGAVFDGYYADAVITGEDELEVVVQLSPPFAYFQDRAGVVVGPEEDPKIIVSDAPMRATLYGLPSALGTLAGGFVATNGQRFSFGAQLVDPFADAFDFALAGPSVDAAFRSRSSGEQKDGFFQAFIPAAHVQRIFGLTVAQAATGLRTDRLDRDDDFDVSALGVERGLGNGVLVAGDGFGFSAPYFSLSRATIAPPPPADDGPGFVPLPNGQNPALPQGSGVAVIGGVEVPVTVSSTPDGRLVLEFAGSRVEVLVGEGSQLVRDADGRLVLEIAQGGEFEVAGAGLAPGSIVYVWLFSDPELVALVRVGADGTYRGSVPLDGWASGRPIPPGGHTLQLVGTGPDGDVRALNLGVRVVTRLTPGGASVPRVADAAVGSGDPVPTAPSPTPAPATPPAVTPPPGGGSTPAPAAPTAPPVLEATEATADDGGLPRTLILMVGLLVAALAAYALFARRKGSTG